MNVKDFEYLIELSKAGSISKASKALYISQPALSKFLQKMESEAGTALFQHVGRQLVPTYAGEQCIQTASEILFLHNRLQSVLSDIARQQEGQIRLGIPLSRSNYFISKILPEFYKQYPKICIHIYEDATKILLKKLRVGELDLVFGNFSQLYEDLNYEIISKEEMVLAAPACFGFSAYAQPQADYQFPCITPDIWKDYPFLMLSDDQMSRTFADEYLKKNNMKPNVILKIRNLGQVLLSVQHGLGLTICPSIPVLEPNAEEKIQYFSLLSDDGPTIRETAVFYRKDAYLSIATKILIYVIKENYAKF